LRKAVVVTDDLRPQSVKFRDRAVGCRSADAGSRRSRRALQFRDSDCACLQRLRFVRTMLGSIGCWPSTSPHHRRLLRRNGREKANRRAT